MTMTIFAIISIIKAERLTFECCSAISSTVRLRHNCIQHRKKKISIKKIIIEPLKRDWNSKKTILSPIPVFGTSVREERSRVDFLGRLLLFGNWNLWRMLQNGFSRLVGWKSLLFHVLYLLMRRGSKNFQ